MARKKMAGERTQKSVKIRLIAGLSYLIILTGFIGLLAAALINHFSKNKYTKFHVGQAFFLTAGLILLGLTGFAINFALFTMSINISLDLTVIHALLAIIALVYLACAILAFMGKDFKIPIISRFVDK